MISGSEEELNKHSLKISSIAKYQKESNKYRKRAILSELVAAIFAFLDINLLTKMIPGKTSMLEFSVYMVYTLITVVAICYSVKMEDKKKKIDEIISDCKNGIPR